MKRFCFFCADEGDATGLVGRNKFGVDTDDPPDGYIDEDPDDDETNFLGGGDSASRASARTVCATFAKLSIDSTEEFDKSPLSNNSSLETPYAAAAWRNFDTLFDTALLDDPESTRAIDPGRNLFINL